MQTMKDDITLEQVRAIMESQAKKRGCSISEIEIKHVQDALGKGSNGTVGAYVKRAKQEYINAKAYERGNISTQLKSALIEEINRFADNARMNASEGLMSLELDFNEVLKLNGESREIINSLNSEMEAQRETTGRELRRLSDELARKEQLIDTQRETESQLRKDLETNRNNLDQAHLSAAELNRKIGGLEADLLSIGEKREELSKKLSEAEKDLNTEKTTSALQAQALAHQKEAYDLLSKDKITLESTTIVNLNDKIDGLSTKNEELHDKLEKLRKEHIEDLKQSTKTPSGEKK